MLNLIKTKFKTEYSDLFIFDSLMKMGSIFGSDLTNPIATC